MIYGYIRVSTKNQERYGNSLEDQTNKLLAAGVAPDQIYQDAYTGTKVSRPNFNRLLTKLQPGDTLIVTKLDRFARTAADGATLIQSLLAKDISVHILNMGKADNSPMGKLLTTVLLAFAEFERDMIVERTQTGKATAKANNPNWREGRKPLQITPNQVKALQNANVPVKEACEQLGISRSSWYNLLSKAG